MHPHGHGVYTWPDGGRHEARGAPVASLRGRPGGA